MFTNKNHRSNFLKKCLGLTYVLCTVIVTVIIIFLENTPKDNVLNLSQYREIEGVNSDKLLDLPHFEYVINNGQVCSRKGKGLLAIVIVTSYAGDQEARSAIRRSYPSKLLLKFRIRRVFLLSLIDENKNKNHVSQNAILDENQRFKDIVQGSFIEDYRNLTYKHVMGLHWAAKYCSEADYVIKMDSDIIFDYYKLNLMLKSLPQKENVLAGYVMANMRPVREHANKWFVSDKEYPRKTYPNFLSGWLYITTPSVSNILYQASFEVPYFWIDDLFVTGLLVERLNMSFVKLNKYYTTHPEYLQCCIDKPKLSCDYFIGPTGGDNSLMIKFQKYSENCFYRSCRKRKEANSLRNTCIAKWKEEPFGKGKPVVNVIHLNSS